jgi:hypothetical protein
MFRNVVGLENVSTRVINEYVRELREEIRQDIVSQSPQRLWRALRRHKRGLLRRTAKAAASPTAATTAAARGATPSSDGEESSSEEDDFDEDEWRDSESHVLSEAQAMLLYEELGTSVFDDM